MGGAPLGRSLFRRPGGAGWRGCAGGVAAWMVGPFGPGRRHGLGAVVAGVARPVPASLSPRHCPRGGAGLEGRAATASFSVAVPAVAPPWGGVLFL